MIIDRHQLLTFITAILSVISSSAKGDASDFDKIPSDAEVDKKVSWIGFWSNLMSGPSGGPGMVLAAPAIEATASKASRMKNSIERQIACSPWPACISDERYQFEEKHIYNHKRERIIPNKDASLDAIMASRRRSFDDFINKNVEGIAEKGSDNSQKLSSHIKESIEIAYNFLFRPQQSRGNNFFPMPPQQNMTTNAVRPIVVRWRLNQQIIDGTTFSEASNCSPDETWEVGDLREDYKKFAFGSELNDACKTAYSNWDDWNNTGTVTEYCLISSEKLSVYTEISSENSDEIKVSHNIIHGGGLTQKMTLSFARCD